MIVDNMYTLNVDGNDFILTFIDGEITILEQRKDVLGNKYYTHYDYGSEFLSELRQMFLLRTLNHLQTYLNSDPNFTKYSIGE